MQDTELTGIRQGVWQVILQPAKAPAGRLGSGTAVPATSTERLLRAPWNSSVSRFWLTPASHPAVSFSGILDSAHLSQAGMHAAVSREGPPPPAAAR